MNEEEEEQFSQIRTDAQADLNEEEKVELTEIPEDLPQVTS